VLTVLQQKLAEVHGLAMGATVVTHKVEELTEDPVLRRELERMRADAEETRARCVLVARILPEDLFDEVRAHAISTHETSADLVGAWFKAGTDPLRAWTYLAMGEAAEVAMWSALAALAGNAEEPNVAELVEWGLPIQRRHLAVALDGVVAVAAAVDAVGPRWG
jgi:hypothetical protein